MGKKSRKGAKKAKSSNSMLSDSPRASLGSGFTDSSATTSAKASSSVDESGTKAWTEPAEERQSAESHEESSSTASEQSHYFSAEEEWKEGEAPSSNVEEPETKLAPTICGPLVEPDLDPLHTYNVNSCDAQPFSQASSNLPISDGLDHQSPPSSMDNSAKALSTPPSPSLDRTLKRSKSRAARSLVGKGEPPQLSGKPMASIRDARDDNKSPFQQNHSPTQIRNKTPKSRHVQSPSNPLRTHSLRQIQDDVIQDAELSFFKKQSNPASASELNLEYERKVLSHSKDLFEIKKKHHRAKEQFRHTKKLHAKSSYGPNTDKLEISTKKGLSVDSPSFTPATLPVPPGKGATIPSQAANAPAFTPRNIASSTPTPTAQLDVEPSNFNPSHIKEFTPQGYDLSQQVATNGAGSDISFDAFSLANVGHALPTPQYNPYLEENANVASNGTGYFQAQGGYSSAVQPLQYHHYAPIGPHREDLLSYQRLGHDFFMPANLREELQKKSEASLQVMPNSQLPSVDAYHTLVALDTNHQDTNHQKKATVFGYPSWVYKATSSKDGHLYCLRRLKGYKLTNENVIRSVKDWRRVNNGAVVTVHSAFTTGAFGDSSLVFVTDYHPLSKTLVEHHSAAPNRYGNRLQAIVPEQDIWAYIVQLASAIKSVHEANLAVRCMDPSKILVTNKHRIRLNACSVLDVVQHGVQRSLTELQQEDFQHFGRLIVAVATNNLASNAQHNPAFSEQMARNYTPELREVVSWLLTPPPPEGPPKSINDFIQGISSHTMDVYDKLTHAEDTLTSEISRELENGRIARLLMKLGTINERPEYAGQSNWSETGERYMLKLFRDYVFHQVDSNGNAVVDMGHILTQLNRLDAGIDQSIRLTDREGNTDFIVTYKELKKQVAAAFSDLTKSQSSGKGRAF